MGLIAMSAKRWNKGIVPYTITPAARTLLAVNNRGQTALAVTILEFIKLTRVQLVPRVRQRDYVEIVTTSRRLDCHSEKIGRKGGRQLVRISMLRGPRSIGAGCLIHEFCHVLGLKHEHQRIDRDTYVKVNMDRACERGREGDYKKLSPPWFVPHGKYDFRSIMHYSPDGVLFKRATTLNKRFGNNRLSAGDTLVLQHLYGRR